MLNSRRLLPFGILLVVYRCRVSVTFNPICTSSVILRGCVLIGQSRVRRSKDMITFAAGQPGVVPTSFVLGLSTPFTPIQNRGKPDRLGQESGTRLSQDRIRGARLLRYVSISNSGKFLERNPYSSDGIEHAGSMREMVKTMKRRMYYRDPHTRVFVK